MGVCDNNSIKPSLSPVKPFFKIIYLLTADDDFFIQLGLWKYFQPTVAVYQHFADSVDVEYESPVKAEEHHRVQDVLQRFKRIVDNEFFSLRRHKIDISSVGEEKADVIRG